VKVHEDPVLAKTLLAPDGNPVPEDFTVPPGIIEAPVCNATGKLPISGVASHKEVLVKGEGPTLKCTQASDEERKDLKAALADAAKNPRFTHSGAESLHAYAAMVNVYDSGFERLFVTPTPEPIYEPPIEPSVTPVETPGSATNTPETGGQSQPTPVPKKTPVPTRPALPTPPSVPLIPTPSAYAGDGLGPDDGWA
ncbi:MAG TPA: hypothetical protein VFE62_14730, partial [Gemmataceae bacterium]|nr:hypothetical protein [Gemmataceae bacterium]